jgi:hypothetical protein
LQQLLWQKPAKNSILELEINRVQAFTQLHMLNHNSQQ